MALTATIGETKFGVGDTVRVSQKIVEGDKQRLQIFEGMVIKIKGHGELKTFTVRRIGSQKIGIERIFPINSPVIEKVSVVRQGTRGVRRAKLYYTRDKSAREIEKIYSRAKEREKAKQETKKSKAKPKSKTKSKPKAKSKTAKTSKKK